jgi:hypothetical protein
VFDEKVLDAIVKEDELPPVICIGPYPDELELVIYLNVRLSKSTLEFISISKTVPDVEDRAPILSKFELLIVIEALVLV